MARHHLDKLAAGGYLEVFVARSAGGGAGRPSKRYRLSGRATGLERPVKGDDLLITLLGRALALVPRPRPRPWPRTSARSTGGELAAQMSTGDGQRSFRTALHAIADALTAHGFAAHAEARGGSLALIKDSCPFFDTAKQHPVICAVDRGMVRGMLAGLYGEAVTATESSRALGDDACVSLSRRQPWPGPTSTTPRRRRSGRWRSRPWSRGSAPPTRAGSTPRAAWPGWRSKKAGSRSPLSPVPGPGR